MAAGNNWLPKDGDDGSTPIHEDEIELLIPGIRTRAELNAWEATNIAHANEWAFGRARLDILSVEILRDLHRRMFDAVWKWAGEFRRTDNNISPHHWPDVPVLVRDLLDDARAQYDASDKSPGALDEISVRFHHRLVRIHPWQNGNGRHARLATELLQREWNRPPFTWGAKTQEPASVRDRYLAALRAADGGNYRLLQRFVRS
jgi:Fic-DOC domain mobile mystery protein B